MIRNPERPRVILATPSPISHRTAEENLGLGYLAAVLRQSENSVRVIDGWLAGMTSQEIATEILTNPPELFLGFACYRSNMEKAMEVIHLLRESGFNLPVIAGGFGPTFHSEEFLKSGVDIVVRGEAEETIIDLVDHFTKGTPTIEQIPGISYVCNEEIRHNQIRPLKTSLEDIPFPSRDTMHLAIKRKTPVHILSTRGCQAHCTFCSIVSFQRLAEGPQWRQRSIKNFVDELESIAHQGARFIKVVDDSLIEPPRNVDWCKQLADEIEKRGLSLRLRGSIRADRVTDEIMFHLRRAGFFAFSCGIENGSDTALQRMGKSARVKNNVEALEAFRKYGIYVQAGHILFDHGTTMNELEENYQFLSKYDWTISKGVFTEMYAADGTPFTKLLTRNGLLKEDEKGLGNNTYSILNQDSALVYEALKAWHKSHIVIYDMTIDAISAPKALEEGELKLFHPLCINLKRMDLAFMRQILDMVQKGKNRQEVIDFTSQQIVETSDWYKDHTEKVNRAYELTGLIYDAERNPFIC